LSAGLRHGGTVSADSGAVPGTESRAFDPQLVRRPRLVSRLREARDATVVLLTAPAGYGKTTTLHQWLGGDERPSAWITLDDADNDPAALVASLATALDQVDVDTADARAALSAPEPSISGIVLPRLARALVSSERAFVLVLDDVHMLVTREALDALTAIASRLPAHAQLVLASRVEPPLPLGRMRAHRRLVELHDSDLAMTESETAELVAVMGLELDPGEQRTLLARTEGWPAALYLAGLSLIDQPDVPGALAHFAGDDRMIVDYLRDEFLSQISPDALGFLTRTSVLDTLSGDVCDAVLQGSSSAGTLRDLARSNMLIVPLDHRDHSYRYHALFAEMLHSELERLEPQLAPQLHRRASDWYAERDDHERAITHAIAAGDAERAGELLWDSFPTLISRGRNASIRHWLGRFTDNQLAGCAPLAITAAHSAMVSGQGALAEHWTSVAAARLDDTAPVEVGTPIEAGVLIAKAELGRDGVGQMAEDARRAAALLPEDSPWHSPRSMVEGIACHLTGDPKRARERLEEGARLGAVGAPLVEVLCVAQLALLAADEDDRDEAIRLAMRAREQLERCGLGDYETMALVFAVSALVLAQDGRVEDASSDARRSAELLQQLADFAPWYEAETELVLARALLRLDDVDSARALLVDASRALRSTHDATALRDWLQEAWATIDSSAADVASGRLGLTPAELRVLQFLPTHRSFREIANELYVSANTVKTQARALYRKLDVSSRAEAVDRARDAGLLDSKKPGPGVS
jgi:LuxR family maltose regulon positive regulatory protein